MTKQRRTDKGPTDSNSSLGSYVSDDDVSDVDDLDDLLDDDDDAGVL